MTVITPVMVVEFRPALLEHVRKTRRASPVDAEDYVQELSVQLLSRPVRARYPLSYAKRMLSNLIGMGDRRRARSPELLSFDHEGTVTW